MSTARDIIKGSLRLIGVLAAGEEPDSEAAADALLSMNQLLASWSNDSLMIPVKVRETFALVVNQQNYTMGPSGDFNTTRPVRIENAIVIPTASSPNVELAIKMLNKDQWADILVKGTQSTFPRWMYTEYEFPQSVLQVWPIPTAACSLGLYSWKALDQVANLSAALTLQPGADRMLKYNLAVELAPEYGKQIGIEIATIAADSKASIERINTKPLYMSTDDALVGPRGTFNWLTGDTV